MTEEKRGELIPLIRDKSTRDIIKKQFNDAKSGSLLNPANTKSNSLQESLARINRTMSEIKEINRKSGEYLAKHHPEMAAPPDRTLANEYAAGRMKDEPVYNKPSTIDEEAALKAYRQKQEEMKKTREKNNAKVTREYRLTSRRPDPKWDK